MQVIWEKIKQRLESLNKKRFLSFLYRALFALEFLALL